MSGVASGRHRVFVYGTLMSGGRNAALMSGARLVDAAARTDAAVWRMAQFNSSSSPGRQTPGVQAGGVQAGGGWHIAGEVWEVDDAGLARLDRLEQNGLRYRRQLVGLAGGGEAWLYVLIAPDAPSDDQDRIIVDRAQRLQAWDRVER